MPDSGAESGEIGELPSTPRRSRNRSPAGRRRRTPPLRRSRDEDYRRRRSPPRRRSRSPRRGGGGGGGGGSPPPPPPREPSRSPMPVDDGTLAAAAEAALAAAAAGVDDPDEEALIAARRARRAAILAKHRVEALAEAPAAAVAPSPPPPAAPPTAPDDDAVTDAAGALRAPGAEGLWRGGGAGVDAAQQPPPPPRTVTARPPPPDMFADDADPSAFAAPTTAATDRGLVDAFDDADGYYKFTVGEVMGGGAPGDATVRVFATHGRGVFSSVLRARVMDPGSGPGALPPPIVAGDEVAVKVVRANELMARAVRLEITILAKLAGADPTGKRHCVRLLAHFEYRGHVCLAFDALDTNLRELTKKYGRGVGLSLAAVRAYGAQLLAALHHARSCGIIHADLKPDNILVSSDRSKAVLADWGSAMFAGDNEITPYLVSRFYRAPEVILGLPYSHALDVWSLGCVLYELYTGRLAFPGRSNNEMLALMQDTKGALPRRMARRGAFAARHYEGVDGRVFARVAADPVTGAPARRLVEAPAVKADVATRLARAGAGTDDPRSVAALADLLERMFALDPERRITPRDALRHPFIKGLGGG